MLGVVDPRKGAFPSSLVGSAHLLIIARGDSELVLFQLELAPVWTAECVAREGSRAGSERLAAEHLIFDTHNRHASAPLSAIILLETGRGSAWLRPGRFSGHDPGQVGGA